VRDVRRVKEWFMYVATQPRNLSECDEESRWYALHTKSCCEAKVAAYLSAFGIEVLLPDYPVRHEWHDRVKLLRRPVFPGYLFGRFQKKPPVAVLGAPGLAHVVGFADGPAPIPDSQIESVRRLVESGLTVCACPMLKVGKRVRVCNGPLAGLEGRLDRIKSRFRFVVTVDLLCRSVAAEVDPASIEVIS
jgi:transcription antitermination factor NusG